jgi:hypothetical protein
MQIRLAVGAFVFAQLFFVFLYIYTQSLYIQIMYQKQKYDKQKHELLEQQQHLYHELYRLKDLRSAHEYAQVHNMQKITRKQLIPLESVLS